MSNQINTSTPNGVNGGTDNNYLLPLAILTSLFFMWGFITSMNDVLIPHLKAVFSLSNFEAQTVNSAFFGAYALVSYPAGLLVKKVGYQKGLVVGLCVAALGCVMFASAADVHKYIFFLLALFILASGITILQVSANPYVSHLGPDKSASTRLTLTQAFNSLGTTVAPWFGATFILSVAIISADKLAAMSPEELQIFNMSQAQTVKMPYYLLAGILGVLAVIFYFLKLPTLAQDEEASVESGDSIFRHLHLVLGAVAIFMYVGGEVAIGSFLVNYFGEANIGGLPEHEAAKYVTYYWGGAMVGRFIGAGVMFLNVPPTRVLAFNSVMVVVLLVVTITSSGTLAMFSILAVGLFNSIMFPTIFSLAINKLGALTSRGSGLLCVAIVGGALIPPLQGFIADKAGNIQISFILPIFCYLYILFYALKGYQVKEK